MQHFADQLFAGVRTVAVGGVDEIDAEFRQARERRAGSDWIGGRPPDSLPGNAHGAETEAVDDNIATDRDVSGGSGRWSGGHERLLRR